MWPLDALNRWWEARRNSRAAETSHARDARPADGVLDRASVVGAIGTPNARNPSYHAFERFDPEVSPVATDPLPGRSRWVGPTEPLLGRVVVLSLFLGRQGSPWTDKEIAYAQQAIERAGVWVEQQAMRWRAAVNLEIADTYFTTQDDHEEDVVLEFAPRGGGGSLFGGVPRGEDVDLFDANDIVKIVAGASRGAAGLGFADVADLVAQAQSRVRADACVWLLHLRSEGRSMAIPEEATALSGVNLAACYAREADLPGPLQGPVFSDPITFVHELLHLFGATDKYDVPLSRFDRRMLTDRDIMVLAHESLPRLRVDPLTALELGWPAIEPDDDH